MMKTQLKQHLFLIGFMGVGKSSTARALSRRLDAEEIDTDAMLVDKLGMSIEEVFASHGEEYFRQQETALLTELQNRKPCIVSCGGGMVMRSDNVTLMKQQGQILLLTAKPETIFEHVKDSTNRPLLNGNMNVEYIQEMMKVREPKYSGAADLIVETDGLIPGQVAEKIIEML